MFSLLRVLIVGIGVFLFSSCAAPIQPNHIDRAARSHLDGVEVYLIVSQKEIGVVESNTMIIGGFGMGVMGHSAMSAAEREINNKSNSYAESLVEPIRANLTDFDFANIQLDQLNAILREIEWLHSKELVLLDTREESLYRTKWETSQASATLFIEAQHLISPDLSYVLISVEAIMFPNAEVLEAFKAKDDGNENPVNLSDSIYHNSFLKIVPLKVEGLVKDRVGILARNRAEKVRVAVNKGIAKVCDAIARDLEKDERADLVKK